MVICIATGIHTYTQMHQIIANTCCMYVHIVETGRQYVGILLGMLLGMLGVLGMLGMLGMLDMLDMLGRLGVM